VGDQAGRHAPVLVEDAVVGRARLRALPETIDPAAQVPPSNLLAYRRARPAPYLYCAAEIGALLAATDTLRSDRRCTRRPTARCWAFWP
jgi:hypothetical protein